MNSNFSYTGKVTVKSIFKDRVITSQHFNNGTVDLFQTYAKALSGQDITDFLPSYIDVEVFNGSTYDTCMRSQTGVSVVRSYVDGESPCARFTTTMTNSMFNTSKIQSTTPIRLCLKTSPLPFKEGQQQVLATIDTGLDGLPTIIKDSPTGTQIIIVWDLYVDNEEG